MAWQKRLFAVNAVLSADDPDRFVLDEEFSLILVGSVFSHLPDALFQRWLGRLYRLVAPDGILVFSVHGEEILPANEQMDRKGICYLSFSESASLGTDVYGMTYVSDAYVDASIARLDPTRTVQFRRYRKGLYENQDLYVVAGANVDLGDFVLRIPPIGGFELMSGPADGEVKFYGWAIDLNPGHQITQFEVFHDGISVHVGAPVADLNRLWHYFPGAPNIPVRWQFSLPSRLRHPQCVIRVELRSTTGAVAYAYADIPDGEANPTSMKGHLT
jgi:SAM-dependent methyltransferase